VNIVPIHPSATTELTDADIQWQGWSTDDPSASATSNAVTIHEGLSAWRDTVIRERKIPRLRIGIPSFDRAMRGLQPGELFGIVARTASGKTHLTNHIVEDMLAQRPTSAVLVVNLEMPVTQLVGRLLRRYFKMTDESLEREIQSDSLEVNRFVQRFANLRFLDRGALSLDQIAQDASDLQRALGPTSLDAIVIDHCGLLRSSRGSSAYERATDNAIGLKQLARRLNTIVVAVIQANRAAGKPGDDEPVALESARDSGAYEENADFMISMGPLMDGRPKGLPNYVKLRLAKNRRGPQIPVTLVFDRTSLRLHELEEHRG
jgi:replicative DNA helicase